jgi:hypothetical protein
MDAHEGGIHFLLIVSLPSMYQKRYIDGFEFTEDCIKWYINQRQDEDKMLLRLAIAEF